MNQEKYIVFYDGHCGLCREACRAVKRLGPKEQVRFVNAQDPGQMKEFPDIDRQQTQEEMLVRDSAGKVWGGYEAAVRLAGEIPVLRRGVRVLQWSAVQRIGKCIYKWVSRNRRRMSRLTFRFSP